MWTYLYSPKASHGAAIPWYNNHRWDGQNWFAEKHSVPNTPGNQDSLLNASSVGNRDLQCINNRGITTPQCIHHLEVTSSQCTYCSHHRVISLHSIFTTRKSRPRPSCVHHQEVILDNWKSIGEPFNNLLTAKGENLTINVLLIWKVREIIFF